MATANIPDPTPVNSEEHWPQHKLDLSYFTAADRCPLMVRRRARGAFELFLYLAYRFIHGGGEPVVAEHEELCAACGVVPDGPHASSEIAAVPLQHTTVAQTMMNPGGFRGGPTVSVPVGGVISPIGGGRDLSR